MVETQYVSTAQVAQCLGVSVTTVKRWVDDGILPAHRTAGGHRKLLVADVLRLARENHFPCADLSPLHHVACRNEAPAPAVAARNLFEALQEGDAGRVRAVLQGAYRAGMPMETLADAVIAPAVNRLGHEWEKGRLDVLYEHRGT